MNRSEWRSWCSDLSENSIPGVCSKTTCECDREDNPGVAGPICELTCPTGFSNGQELACSGRNGQCFAANPDEMYEQNKDQINSGEIRNADNFRGPEIPIWLGGPEPSMEGRCQCALGSGVACSIPCDQCNNGTYGFNMASQYGICDAYNGICRSLPMFMRYNTKYESENFISYNTTAFTSEKGLAQWEYPERFIYESDETLALMARNYLLDRNGMRSGLDTLDVDIPLARKTLIETILHVWPNVCKMDNYDERYLNNDQYVTNGMITVTGEEDRILRSIELPAWGKCRPIDIGDDFYLCFYDGQIYAYDRSQRSSFEQTGPGALYVIQTGDITPASEGIAFTIRNPTTIYAYGGKRVYEKTEEVFNSIFKIKIRRVPWNPVDILLVEWSEVLTTGQRPEGSSYAPIYAFTGFLYVLDTDYMYKLRFATGVENAEWVRYDAPLPDTDAEPVEMKGNSAGQVYVKYNNNAMYTFTSTSEDPWSEGGLDFNFGPTIRDGVNDGRSIDCVLNVRNRTLGISGNELLIYNNKLEDVTIYLEEWNTLGSNKDPSVIRTFMDTVRWRVYDNGFSWDDVSDGEKKQIVDIIERVHMHQARWSVISMMHSKAKLSNILNMDVSIPVALTTEPVQSFLDVFRSASAGFLSQTPVYSPRNFTVSVEGEMYERSLVVSANYYSNMTGYEQEIQMDTEVIVIVADWSPNSLRLRLKEKYGQRYMEWLKAGQFRTWHLIIRLEEFQYAVDPNWTPDKASLSGAFHLYVIPEASPTYTMKVQTSNFLKYSASHCSLTADDECPSTLPYINLPCSGRGRCNLACQCVCEVAKSILQSDENALIDIDPSKSPWRGSGCEITCPGYDGFNLDSICSGRGICQSDGTCSCNPGLTGDACQFECPIDSEGDECSAHGGCGTKAYELSSFKFVNDQYLDTLTATNRKKYSSALSNFYASCVKQNFVKQEGVFGFNVKKKYPSFVVPEDAFSACQEINDNLDLDMTQIQNRIYPAGQCVGVDTVQNKYVPVILRSPQTEFMHFEAVPIFECLATDCYIKTAESDDFTILGLKYKLLSPSFEFDIEYIHGYSSGRSSHIINGNLFHMDFDWTPYQLNLTIGSELYGYNNIVYQEKMIERVKMIIEMGALQVTLYPSTLPLDIPSETPVWIAPRYNIKYVYVRENMVGQYFLVPSEDTGNERTLMTRLAAEYDCDQEPECLGLIQFNDLKSYSSDTEPTLYALYTETRNLNGWATYDMPSSDSYLFLKKMSMVYQGRETSLSLCAVVEPGLSKYPTVSYTEDYNIPIKNIDIRLAEDEDTGSVVVGDGYWNNCWKKIDSIDTKMGCFEYARDQEKVYGFSFSTDTNICLVYSGITDNTKIKLDRFNSESRLSLFDPCDGDSTDWIPEVNI